MDASENYASKAAQSGGGARLAEVFSPDRILVDAEISSSKRMLEVISGLFTEDQADSLDSNVVFRSLFRRERTGSTCVGNGVALPHGRMDGIQRPLGAIVRMKTPIDMDAIDDKPVSIAFGLLVPTDGASDHIHLLRKLAQGIEEYGLHHRIMKAKNPSQVYRQLAEFDESSA